MGPLHGVRVVELEAIGPVPYCAMLLGDLGADVIRIDRKGVPPDPLRMLMGRNRRSVAVDLKQQGGSEVVLRIVETADVLIEGLRPGVAERLGVGPEAALARNPRLVYGRMTGWGQTGPRAPTAGHDIDYIALTGALHAIGPGHRPPPPPLNLVGDFGGGSMFLALGVLAALHERTMSDRGQVVDAAMVDGAASLMTMAYEMRDRGFVGDGRGVNLLDGGAPFYRCYETADGGYVAVGAIEPQFYSALLERLGLEDAHLPAQLDASGWPRLHATFAEIFATKTRREWQEIFSGTDACVAPVLSMSEAPEDPHLRARGTFVDVDGATVPGPAPRFGRSEPAPPTPPAAPGTHTTEVLAEVGYGQPEIFELRDAGVVG